jgi:hypothetical protein
MGYNTNDYFAIVCPYNPEITKNFQKYEYSFVCLTNPEIIKFLKKLDLHTHVNTSDT